MAVVNGTANNDLLNGTESGDLLLGFGGDDWLDGGLGADQMEGGTGNDAYVVRDIGDTVVELPGEGTDYVVSHLASYTLTANVEDLYTAPGMIGFIGSGNALDNDISGTIGNDWLDGGLGADLLIGKAGNDTYYVDNTSDFVLENADEGYDSIWVYNLAGLTLHSNVEKLVFNGNSAFAALGNALNNDITTGSGNDTLDGGTGNDVLRGGAGDDTYTVDSNSDQVVEYLNEGIDTVRTATQLQYYMPSYVENLVFTGIGGAALYAYGNELANQIKGGSGNDTFFGLAGDDTLIGFSGNDSYWIEDAGDKVIEAAGGGDDHIFASLPYYVLPDHVESVSAWSLDLGVHFVGNSAVNWLTGSEVNDTLNGAGGGDMMTGRKGDDTYFVDHKFDVAREEENEGFDTVNYVLDGSYTLGANLEKLVYLGFFAFGANGNGLNNVLVTAGGDDQLNGWAGADTMQGKGGDDTYFVDNAADAVVEAANEGIDTVRVTIGAYVLPANVENLVLDAPWMSINATGNALANRIEGSYENDTLDGAAGADTLVGGGGDDVYIVDSAGDTVVEHDGDGTDEVRTAIGSRTDFTKMYVLPAAVEKLTGTSLTGQGVFGNALDNVLNMGAGADLIVLQDGGIDTVNGGGGDDFVYFAGSLTVLDTVDGGAGYDAVGLLGSYSIVFSPNNLINVEKLAVYSSGGGDQMPNHYDLTMSNQNVAPGKNLMVVGLSLRENETLTFDGSAEVSGTFNVRGGKGLDTITGGGGGDQIFGNIGADILRGGGGNDLFEYYSAAESAGDGRDRILDFQQGDRINLRTIDSDGNAANGNNKFAFIGSDAFSFVPGQLRAAETGNGWLVEGDIDGDGAADLSILVSVLDYHVLGASDFIL